VSDPAASGPGSIVVRGARQHNLRNVDVEIPRDRLVVITGLSGSGKSSLAFDTIYAEGQRRYVESLSSYARQFLGQMEKPKYDHIRGLSPTISIEQKAASNNPRSTVGTITEVFDYLRVLWARIGRQHCPRCGHPVERLSAQEVVDRLLALAPGTRFLLLARLVDNRKGEYRELLQENVREGFTRFRIDGAVHGGDELPTLDKKRKHTIDVVVDRLAVPESGGLERSRLTDSVETALRKGQGRLWVQLVGGEERLYSEELWCHHCDHGFPELTTKQVRSRGLAPSGSTRERDAAAPLHRQDAVTACRRGRGGHENTIFTWYTPSESVLSTGFPVSLKIASMRALCTSTSPRNPAAPRARAISASRRNSAVPTPRLCQASMTSKDTSAKRVAGAMS
jgi:excinuclease ABC A subunit